MGGTKGLIAFCTREGSGLGHSGRDIQRACPQAKVAKGLAIRGGGVQKGEQAIQARLRESGVLG
jgi:hypothetical protein